MSSDEYYALLKAAHKRTDWTNRASIHAYNEYAHKLQDQMEKEEKKVFLVKNLTTRQQDTAEVHNINDACIKFPAFHKSEYWRRSHDRHESSVKMITANGRHNAPAIRNAAASKTAHFLRRFPFGILPCFQRQAKFFPPFAPS